MWLNLLQAQGLRCFSNVDIKFSPGINVLYGNNGVGKTSILEGISVLSCGKSFRTSKLNHIIHDQMGEITLFGEVNSIDSTVFLGVHNKLGVSELRIDREKVSKWSELAVHLPVLEIHPESYLLIMGGPIERRKFLNWGMFHVEPSYGRLWSEYNRAIKQRNISLRSRQFSQARNWHTTIADLGEKIAVFLETYVNSVIPYINAITAQFDLTESIEMNYYPGWNKEFKLIDILEDELKQEDIGFTTLAGPHRGDLKITWEDKPFSKSSSRGQQKVLAVALKIAQANHLKDSKGKNSIYLIDELPAELDDKRRRIALDILSKLDSQIIISAVTRESVNYENADIKWFHVEQSSVSAVV